ncbi:recombinase family protein [Saccharopolyspora sp. NPDC050642]|uniref:recombinase family protein n=1 Tax=Saccharopolyspora sp. NPDC050642 TaxID=3157099 RepID=UPI0033F7A239
MGDLGVGAGQGQRRPVFDSYARLSRVPETGELEKIETQHADNRTVIERLGGVLGEELDDGLSAWKKGVRRPDWETLLERVRTGESDGIVVWHTDRLFRQPRDLETLIDLGDEGFLVASAHGQHDLASSDDRFILRIQVAQAAKSSDDTQRRTKRRFAVLREKGVAHVAGRAFGFPGKDRTQPRGHRQEVPADVVERERAALRDASQRVLSREVTQSDIAREWNAAGLLTATGNTWTPVAVRGVLLRARNAGFVEHDGVIVGRSQDEPVISEETFERLQALYAGRRRGRVAGNTYVASGIVECGVCGTPVSGKPHQGTYPDGVKRRQYRCNPSRRGCGKVAADVRAVDRELRAFVIERLSDPRHAQAISDTRSRTTARLEEVLAEITECEALQRGLSERLGRRELTLDNFDRANEPLVKDLARLTAERDTLRSPATPSGPTEAEAAETIAVKWDNGTVADQRGMLTRALSGERMVIDPAPKNGRRTFDPARVHPKNATQPAA